MIISLLAFIICFLLPFIYSTPTAFFPSKIILLTNAFVMACKFERFKAGFKNAAALLQRLPSFILHCVRLAPICVFPL